MDFDWVEDLVLILLRGSIVMIHTLHAVGIVAGGALVAVTLIWTAEEIFEIHKGAKAVKAHRPKRKWSGVRF
jgi:hypothetical protein